MCSGLLCFTRNFRQNRNMRYLSLDWIDAMQAQVASSESLTDLASTHSIGVTQVVTDGPEGSVLYHLQVGNGIVGYFLSHHAVDLSASHINWMRGTGISTRSHRRDVARI